MIQKINESLNTGVDVTTEEFYHQIYDMKPAQYKSEIIDKGLFIMIGDERWNIVDIKKKRFAVAQIPVFFINREKDGLEATISVDEVFDGEVYRSTDVKGLDTTVGAKITINSPETPKPVKTEKPKPKFKVMQKVVDILCEKKEHVIRQTDMSETDFENICDFIVNDETCVAIWKGKWSAVGPVNEYISYSNSRETYNSPIGTLVFDANKSYDSTSRYAGFRGTSHTEYTISVGRQQLGSGRTFVGYKRSKPVTAVEAKLNCKLEAIVRRASNVLDIKVGWFSL